MPSERVFTQSNVVDGDIVTSCSWNESGYTHIMIATLWDLFFVFALPSSPYHRLQRPRFLVPGFWFCFLYFLSYLSLPSRAFLHLTLISRSACSSKPPCFFILLYDLAKYIFLRCILSRHSQPFIQTSLRDRETEIEPGSRKMPEYRAPSTRLPLQGKY
jgi:hypothetical protein